MDLTRSSPARTRRYTRVRTGCTTCRLRKVKCDEQRPVCHNCFRLRKRCVYEDGVDHDSRPTSSLASVLPTSTGISHTLEQEAVSPATALLNSDFDFGEWGDILEDGDWLGSNPMLPSVENLSSHTARQDNLERGSSMFPYFTSNVNPPFITPFDSANWAIARQYIAGLAPSNIFIAAAIQCVEVLYKSLDQGDEISDAMQSYFSAKSAYLTMLNRDDQGLEPVLIVTFLHCLFEIVAQQEMIPHTLKRKDPLISKVDAWSKLQPWPPIAQRITVWLRWLHTKSMHLGGRGILSPQLFALLPVDRHPVPCLFFLNDDNQPEAGLELLEPTMSALFHFYDELQDISVQASALNRHHRSRGTLADETGVHWISVNIANHLNVLWQTRPWLLRHPTKGLFSNHQDYSQLFKLLLVLCRVCYFAEIIYLDRAQSKDHTASPDAQRARQQIRLSVDEFSGCATTQHLDAAFLWPLFLFAVESRTVADVDWAISKLRLIRNPLWQSDTVTTFVQDLTSEQLSRGERVDSRLFCLQHYGGPPPYI